MASRRILIVSENHSIGGLETHLAGMVRFMARNGHECHMAVGHVASTDYLPAGLTRLIDGLPFRWPATAGDLLKGVDRLTAYIRDQRIAFVHAQPYLSILPAVLAAQRARVPVVLTLHGPANLNAPGEGYGYLHDLLLQFFSLPTASRVYCVSPEVHALVQPLIAGDSARVLPNSVDLNLYAPPVSTGNRWAVIGRLDSFKVAGIKDFCRKAVACKLGPIDIYGDGPASGELAQFILDLGAQDSIRLRGETRHVAERLADGYRGVAGMGRVVLEGAAMDLPVVLVGYGGAKGLLDAPAAARAAWWNFSGRGMDTVSAEELERQFNQELPADPGRFRLRSWVEENHNEDQTWARYLDEISGCTFRDNPLAGAIENVFKIHAGSSGPYLLERDILRDMARALGRSVPAAELQMKLTLDVSAMRGDLCQAAKQLATSLQQVREQGALLQNLTAKSAQQDQQLSAQIAEKQNQIVYLTERLARESQAHGSTTAQLASQTATVQQLSSRVETLHAEALALQERLTAALQKEEQARSAAESARRQLQEAQGSLISAREQAAQIAYLLQAWRDNKSFRVARWMQLVRNQLLHGPMRDRMRFLARMARRAGGRPGPVSTYNIFEEPIHMACQAVTALDRALQGAGHNGSAAPAGAAPALPATSPLTGPASSGLRPTSRRPRTSVVNMVAPLFLDFKGNELMCGGAERYLIELCRIVTRLGYRPEIYQCGHGDWVRHYDGTRVTGLDIGDNINLLNARFHEQVPPGAMTIYSPFFLAQPLHHPRSLGISHGIFWDNAYYQSTPAFFEVTLGSLRSAIGNCERLVSVDTNTINWARGTMHEFGEKFSYVPNFVDITQFKPKGNRADGRLVVLYPRRLYAPRGFWLVAELVPDLVERYPHVDFHFVGKADDQEAEAVRKLEKKFPGRVRWYSLDPDRMHEAYDAADIALIPTTASEGTSLSCLEAMASGNAVIATNVGGLPELIMDGYNGLLISPTAADLLEALERLINDEALREQLKSNARQVAMSYRMDVWRGRWQRTLERLLPPRPAAAQAPEFVHPWAGGVVWGRMMQRPHQLFKALAELGAAAHFVVDEQVEKEQIEPDSGLRILGRRNKLEVASPVVYLYLASSYECLKEFEDATVIYDILDDPKIHEKADKDSLPDTSYIRYHNRLLNEADIVITSSRRLWARYRPQRADILLVPNGVRPEDFRRPAAPRPSDLPAGAGAIIGYYGALAEWFDYRMLDHAAAVRPAYQFVLIGPTTRPEELERLTSRRTNVSYLGEKLYDQLPDYLAHFDVATIPFLVNEITNSVSPVKLFEYLACDKPVVATGFEEIRQYDVVLLADSPEDFVRQLDRALKLRNDPDSLKRARRVVEENTWRARAEQVLAALNSLLKTPTASSLKSAHSDQPPQPPETREQASDR